MRSSEVAIYVPLVGQFDNIGDVILRRQLAARLNAAGEIHVLVGSAPDEFVAALQLSPKAVVHRSVSSWYRHAVLTGTKRPYYFFKPGEMRLALSGLREHVGVLPLLAAVRLKGGGIGCVGVGSRGRSRLAKALATPALKLSHSTFWRDAETQSEFGFGDTVPDLAFAEGLELSSAAPGSEEGKYLVASFRSDRRDLLESEVSALAEFARSHDCEVVIAPQVRRDGRAAELLAHRLGARYSAWTSQDHIGRETELRQLYRNARVVVSNRLHVLVAALTEGAAIAGMGVDVGNKVERHFRTAGIPEVTPYHLRTASSLVNHLVESVNRAEPRRLALLDARRSIDSAFEDIGRTTGLSFGRIAHV
jgi:hypothetical protein